MTTQSVKAQAANLSDGGSVNFAKKGKETSIDFETLISNNMKSYQSNSNENDTVANITVHQKAENQSKLNDRTDKSAKETDQAKEYGAITTKATETESKLDASAAETSMKISNTKAEGPENTSEDEEELLAEVSAMMQAIYEAVMKVLNLTEEELDKLLNEQGMNITDLLAPENLQQLILAANGETDLMAVLTDENLLKQMQDLLRQVEEIMADAELGLTKEQIESLISQAEQNSTKDAVTESGLKNGNEANATHSLKQADAVKDDQSSQTEGKVTANEETGNNLSAASTEEAKEGYLNSEQDNSDTESGPSEFFQSFIDNMVKAAGDGTVNETGSIAQMNDLREIAYQIIEHIKVSVTSNQTSMELQLKPENLGKVNLTVQSNNGVMTAKFVVQNEVTKEALESQMHLLKETFNEQGMKVESIEVTVANYTFDDPNQNQEQKQSDSQNKTSGKKITFEEALLMDEEADENIGADADLGLGGLVDYTA